jgi:hypothetical protein
LQRMKRNNVLPHTLIGGALTLSLLGTMSWNCSVSADEPLTGESETAQAMAVGDYDANDAEPEGQAGAQAVKASSSGSLILDPESQLRLKPGSSRCQVKAPEQKAGSSISKYKPGVPCVPLMLVDDPTTLIVCDKDSSLKADKRTITLSHGKGVYMVGKRSLLVETPLGTITLPGNSAAIIEQTESGLLRVDHLTGPACTLAVKRFKGVRSFSAASGEEICLAPKSLPLQELTPKDGVDRQEIANEANEDGFNFCSNKFAPRVMLDKECLLECDSNSFFQVKRKVYELRRNIDEQETAASPGNKSVEDLPIVILAGDGNEADQHLRPVTLAEAVSTPLPLLEKDTNSAHIRYNSASEIDFSHPSVVSMHKGEALISTTALSFIKTPDSMLRIQAGTLVLISIENGVTKVRNIWENNRNSVCQTVDGQPFNIAAGDESMLANDLRSIYISASKDLVGRRLSHCHDLCNGKTLHFAEISLISLAQSSDLLSQISSSDSDLDQAYARKLNKMAAILVQISASHGMYELMQPPQWRRDAKASAVGVFN